MKKLLLLLIFFLVATNFSFSQTQELKTKDGKIVLLNDDGTWKYKISEKKADEDNSDNPEYASRPYYVEDNELISFEKVKAKIDIKVKALGYGGANTYLTAFGKDSNVKFKKGNIPKIIIKLEGNEEPEDYISILKSEKSKSNKDRRRFKQASMALGGKARDVSENEIIFKLKKIKLSVYELEIDDNIDIGEYAIIPVIQSNGNSLMSYNSTQNIFCFTIE